MSKRTHGGDRPKAGFPKLSSQMRDNALIFFLTQLSSSLLGLQRSDVVFSPELLRGRRKAGRLALIRICIAIASQHALGSVKDRRRLNCCRLQDPLQRGSPRSGSLTTASVTAWRCRSPRGTGTGGAVPASRWAAEPGAQVLCWLRSLPSPQAPCHRTSPALPAPRATVFQSGPPKVNRFKKILYLPRVLTNKRESFFFFLAFVVLHTGQQHK